MARLFLEKLPPVYDVLCQQGRNSGGDEIAEKPVGIVSIGSKEVVQEGDVFGKQLYGRSDCQPNLPLPGITVTRETLLGW